MRLDNIVYRMGLGASVLRRGSGPPRSHRVNGKKVDIPSYEVQPGDVISVRENSRNLQLIKDNVEAAAGRTMPEWMDVNLEQLEGKILAVPTRDQIDISVQEHLIVEFYSQ